MKFDVCSPILGFEDVKQVSLEKIDDVFMKMVSLDNELVSFTMVNPFTLREYDFEIPDSVQDLLAVDKDSNLIILNVVVMQTPIENSAVNFRGPLVFNTDNNKVAQVILNDSFHYGVAEKVSDFIQK
jgi:flagellar assembly factor FliW